jgi:hypothetical protein
MLFLTFIAEHANWISDILLAAMANLPDSSPRVEIRIFVTGPGGDNGEAFDDDVAESGSDLEKKASNNGMEPKLFAFPLVTVQQDRPDFGKMVEAEVNGATDSISMNGK